jgi:hypothetical protein
MCVMISKDIEGFEGLDQIREDGVVISLERWVDRLSPHGLVKQFVPQLERKSSLHGTGYLTVRLAKEGKVTTHRVHRLVAKAFIENPEDKEYVNHKDGDKTNNNLYNLEWVTAGENTVHAIINGLKPENKRDVVNGRYLKAEEK